MSEQSEIAWTDSTHNFWRGCTQISDGCAHCYAKDKVAPRLGLEWGPSGVRVRSKNFYAPLRWNRRPFICEDCGVAYSGKQLGGLSGSYSGICPSCKNHAAFHRRRVFALSLGDWLEGEPKKWRCSRQRHDVGPFGVATSRTTEFVHVGCGGALQPVGGIPIAWLADMLDVIRRCGDLSWILCSKRLENWAERMRGIIAMEGRDELRAWVAAWFNGTPPSNVTILASVENQAAADTRIPELLKIPAARRGLSLEPLLGPVNIAPFLLSEYDKRCFDSQLVTALDTKTDDKVDWVIVGGESGPKARPCNVDWVRTVVQDCNEYGCACFVKQLGQRVVWHDNPTEIVGGKLDGLIVPNYELRRLKDRSGADPSEWPEDLRVRQFPGGTNG